MADFARVNGIVLHYADHGPRDAPVLVFANALGCDFRIWDAVVEQLPGFRLLRYDKRGHGLSEATKAPYRMDDHVADLAALIDHAGIAAATIVGLSVGGMIAQRLAAQRPDLVARLVLSGTAARIGTAEGWNARIEAVAAGGIAAIAPGVLANWFTAALRASGAPVVAGIQAMLTRTSLDGYLGTCAAIRDCDLTATTRRLTAPTLVMVGDQDGSTPPDVVRGLAGLIGNASFTVIAGAGHLPCIERPDEVAALVRAHAAIPVTPS